MTNSKPAGLPPLGNENIPPSVASVIKAWPYNLHRTLAHSPDTLNKWLPFGEHILRQNALPVREREIVILRVGWNCRCAYEWGMHERVARSAGFVDEDFEAICVGSGHERWEDHEAALLDAVDDMQADWTISETNWERLARHFEPAQLVDLIYLSGNFATISVALNALRVPLEQGLPMLPPNRPHYTRARGDIVDGS